MIRAIVVWHLKKKNRACARRHETDRFERSGMPSSVHMLGVDKPARRRAALEVASLAALMELAAGRREVIIGLIDGSVAATHADFATENIQVLSQFSHRAPERGSSAVLTHRT